MGNTGKGRFYISRQKFINYPNLRFINTDLNIIIKATEIAENYNLKPKDSIHMTTALSRDIHNIISDDSNFDSVDIIYRIKL
jgi:predicted nucleic acid-binding protein